jgi:hypothetical protein
VRPAGRLGVDVGEAAGQHLGSSSFEGMCSVLVTGLGAGADGLRLSQGHGPVQGRGLVKPGQALADPRLSGRAGVSGQARRRAEFIADVCQAHGA